VHRPSCLAASVAAASALACPQDSPSHLALAKQSAAPALVVVLLVVLREFLIQQ
jgi:hypothetical protein